MRFLIKFQTPAAKLIRECTVDITDGNLSYDYDWDRYEGALSTHQRKWFMRAICLIVEATGTSCSGTHESTGSRWEAILLSGKD